ncbi:hypothetical protein GQ55_2G127600 [Panicum hallii var. hallii]|uniref:Uncharacterized protein n=1 Tax=Panicum hallii var. hallii TaxID=1504633 RepID=A0A2T7EPB9_9POAL|nr:hypothetical protein GQ55_2G127600 [Panicum hallii var. hallii]
MTDFGYMWNAIDVVFACLYCAIMGTSIYILTGWHVPTGTCPFNSRRYVELPPDHTCCLPQDTTEGHPFQ